MTEYPSSWEHWSPTWDPNAPASPIRPLGPSVDDSDRDDGCFQTEDQRDYYFEALDFEDIFNHPRGPFGPPSGPPPAKKPRLVCLVLYTAMD